MKIISFAWTTPALLVKHKTVTRRAWSNDYAARWRPGERAQAYDRSPRAGGVPVALLTIQSVTYEPDSAAPDSDYAAEGFAYLAALEDGIATRLGFAPLAERGAFSLADFDAWRQAGGASWVIRFDAVHLTGHGYIERDRLASFAGGY